MKVHVCSKFHIYQLFLTCLRLFNIQNRIDHFWKTLQSILVFALFLWSLLQLQLRHNVWRGSRVDKLVSSHHQLIFGFSSEYLSNSTALLSSRGWTICLTTWRKSFTLPLPLLPLYPIIKPPPRLLYILTFNFSTPQNQTKLGFLAPEILENVTPT